MNKQNYQVLKKTLMVYLSVNLSAKVKQHRVNNYLGNLEKHHPELLAIFQEIIEIEEDPDTFSILDHSLFRKVGSPPTSRVDNEHAVFDEHPWWVKPTLQK